MIDTQRAKKAFGRIARFYDLIARGSARLRMRAIARAELRPAEAVLDLGCGTGLSFDPLEQAVGPQGRIIGVELSPDMLAQARKRIAGRGWTNVTLIEANAEEVDLAPGSVDAVVSTYTNDIMHSRRAVERAVQALRPSGRFVAAGVKRATGLRGVLLNPVTLAYSLPFITMPLTASPWRHLEDLMGHLEVTEHQWGTAYIACGAKTAAT